MEHLFRITVRTYCYCFTYIFFPAFNFIPFYDQLHFLTNGLTENYYTYGNALLLSCYCQNLQSYLA